MKPPPTSRRPGLATFTNILAKDPKTIEQLVAEEIGKRKCSYEMAYAIVEKNHPQLFAGLNHPHVQMPKR